jgi:hypothetical protein
LRAEFNLPLILCKKMIPAIMEDTRMDTAAVPVDRVSRDALLWTFLAGVGILLAMAGPFLAGKIYIFDDLGAFHLPIRAFYSEQLAQDRPFDWMPSLFCGYYFSGEGQAGGYHPLHWLLYKYFPLSTALGLEYLLSYPLLWVGGWLFLNRRLRDRAAALFGGLLFFAASFNLLHFPHTNAVAIIAHIPWLLWCIDVVLTDCRRRRVLYATWGIALLTGSQILLGYPQYVWFSLLAEAAYAGFLLYVRRKENEGDEDGRSSLAAWLRVAVGVGIGVLIGSIQWLPTLEVLRESSRYSADSNFTSFGSLHPLDILQLVAPYFFDGRTVGKYTNEFGLYLGAVPLLLVVWLGMRRKELGLLKPLAGASALFAAAALILALGRYGLVYELQRYIPGAGNFRGPARYLLLFQGGMMLLATLGFFLLVRHYREIRQPQNLTTLVQLLIHPTESSWKRYKPLWLTAILSGAVALLGLILQGNSFIAPPGAVLAGACVFLYAAWLITRVAVGNRGALVQLILLSAVDLGLYGLSNSIFGHTADLDSFIASINVPPVAEKGDGPHLCAAPSGPFRQMGSAPFFHSKPDERVVCSLRAFNDSGLRTGDEIILRGYPRADGYLGLEPKKQLDYRRLTALRVAGVRWVQKHLTTEDIPGLDWRNNLWAEVPQPLPRVRLVSQAVVGTNPPNDLDRIDANQTALTEIPLHLPAGSPGTAELREDQPGRIVVTTQCNQPQLLVLAESYHPGWKASAAGEDRPVYRVNGDFLGCVIDPGEEEIVWEFQPDSLRQGRLLSLFGLGMLPLAAIGLFRKPRHPPAIPPEKDEENGWWKLNGGMQHKDVKRNEELVSQTFASRAVLDPEIEHVMASVSRAVLGPEEECEVRSTECEG